MKIILLVLIILCFLVVSPIMADDKEIGRYQIVSFEDNFTFLLDTATGQAWILVFGYTETTKADIPPPLGFKIVAGPGMIDTLGIIEDDLGILQTERVKTKKKDITKGFWIAIELKKKGG